MGGLFSKGTLMTESAIARIRVAIAFTSGEGMRSEFNAVSHGRGAKAPMLMEPKQVLLDAIKELAKIATVAGFGEEAVREAAHASSAAMNAE
jgi:hypothetical protein